MTADSKKYIQTENLSIYYDGVCILKDINFECEQGDFVAIIGMSGSGKSSFLNALANFIPYTGNITIPADIGYIFQSYSLFPWMTVRQNIGFGLKQLSVKEKESVVNQLLNRIELSQEGDKYPAQLSGGQVQRVALARTFSTNPEIILADEPYAALDHHTRDKMHEWLLDILKGSKKTVIFVTHYIEEAIFLADRIIIIKDKTFIADIKMPFAKPRDPNIRYQKEFLDMKFEILSRMDPSVATANNNISGYRPKDKTETFTF